MKTYHAWIAQNPTNDIDDLENLRCEWQELFVSEPKDQEVQIRVQWSGINYKDALAFGGKGKILRQLPLTPGIDAAGTVMASRSPSYKEGDEVIVTGCGLGEHRSGGFGEVITVPEDWVIARPKNLTLKDAMILGTAGFTSALALHQLEKNDLTPQQGPVLVTGSTGGVGALSLILLNQKGYSTEAWTRKEEEVSWLKSLGTTTVTNIQDKDFKTRPLESAVWSAAIDNVGDNILSYILPRIRPHGSVASIGLAKSPNLDTKVFPFILRGVNLLGISSATCPRPLREKIWQSLNEAKAPWQKALTQTVTPKDIPNFTQQMLQGKTKGRTLIQY